MENLSDPSSFKPDLPGPLFKKHWYQDRTKLIAIGAGLLVALLLVFGGVYMWLTRGGGSIIVEKVSEGELPLGGDRLPFEKVTESGLSGRECEHPDRRAIGVMLAGDPINRPVSGFASADMVWELPVLVSDVTRLIAVYQCGQPADIGSVRSARHDYLFLAEGVDAILAHWGGSYHALNRISAGEFQTINALSNPFGAFFRKDNLPAPYNGFTTYERLWGALQKLGYRTETEFKGYKFKDDAPPGERGSGGTLNVAWPGAFTVRYEYDPATNRYQRFWAGVKQLDGEDNTTPVAPSSVVVIRATNEFADGPGGYNDVGIEGNGPATVYQDGQVTEGTWHKDERYKNDPMVFKDNEGKEIELTRGQLWVMAVEPQIGVTWTPVQ